MSLRDDVALYTELSGNDGNHTPIGVIGAYLDGYEKGKASAQPERKTGRWVCLEDEYGDVVDAVCSNCGANGNPDYMHYCPNCGAKMQGV